MKSKIKIPKKNQERENNNLFVKMLALSVRPYCHLPPVKNVPYLFLSIKVDRVRLEKSMSTPVPNNIFHFLQYNIDNIILILSRYLFGKNSFNRLKPATRSGVLAQTTFHIEDFE